MCSSMTSKPSRNARLAAATKASRTLVHIGFGGFARRLPVVAERERRRRDGLPRVAAGWQRAAAFPGPQRRALAAGMGDLDAPFGAAGAPRRGQHAAERGFVVVGIEPEAAMGDAAVARDVGRLHHDQRRAAIGQHAEMHQVPVVGAAVVGAVLAHGRDDDAVGEFDTGQPIGREKGAAHGTYNFVGRTSLEGTERRFSAAGSTSDRQ